MIKRVILVVLDSLGVGALSDAAKYGDQGADTFGHIVEKLKDRLLLPNLKNLGLFNLLDQFPSLHSKDCSGSFGKMICASPAKDTTAGHWELSGIILKKPFPLYPQGFPEKLIKEYEKLIGSKILGNIPASGTEIINRLGDEHVKTGRPIVYTSADSVFQVAAHEGSFGLEKLYGICVAARQMLKGDHAVGRVIARPFTGSNGNYTRTPNRRDYGLKPLGKTVLSLLKDSGRGVIAIGKIEDIFSGEGITESVHTKDNKEGMAALIDAAINKKAEGQLVFANLVDFDMLWGHRRNVEAYASGLMDFDAFLPRFLGSLAEDDALIITSDHGCDPSFTKHTDHTREYAPILVYSKSFRRNIDLGTRKTFADVAQTIADIFNLSGISCGKSILKEVSPADEAGGVKLEI